MPSIGFSSCLLALQPIPKILEPSHIDIDTVSEGFKKQEERWLCRSFCS